MKMPVIDVNRYSQVFTTIETHTAGEPTRIIVSGFPELVGNTMMERKEYCEEHLDHLRTALMCEPRGHRDMVGALLTEPVNSEADLGVIYMDANRWINMCGHASMGCAMAAVETGMVYVTEPVTIVTLDTPAGLVTTEVSVKDGRAESVTIRNVPSFLYQQDMSVKVDGREIHFDVAFGGSFFALVDAEKNNLQLEADQIPNLISLAVRFLAEANRQYQVSHHQLAITGIANAEFYTFQCSPGASQKNIVISGEGQVDRSPCGTGTSAKLAALHAKHQLPAGQPFINENFTGARFTGVIQSETTIDTHPAIIPQITGQAHICGTSTFVLDPADSMRFGFRVVGV